MRVGEWEEMDKKVSVLYHSSREFSNCEEEGVSHSEQKGRSREIVYVIQCYREETSGA